MRSAWLSSLICTVLIVLMVAGCGPTRKGMEARADARERMNLVNAQVSYDQAKRSYEVGQFDRALREIDSAIARYPEAAEYHLLKGRILLEMHRLEPAINSFQQAMELDEEAAAPAYFSGIVFQRWSNHERAYEMYMKAAELDEANAQYLLAAAESLITLGEFESARDLVKPKLAYFEHNSAMHHLLGHIELLLDNPETAARLMHEARLLNPDDQMLLEELAWAQYAAGQYGRAYESLRQLQSMAGERREDWLLLKARCLTFMDRNAEARNIYLELTRLNPGDADVWIELGAVAWELGDHRRVQLCGRRALALAPDRFEGYLLQALHEQHLGNHQAAARLIRQAGERSHDSILPHLMLAHMFEQTGHYQDALDAYAAALRVDPESSEAQAGFSRLSEMEHLTAAPLHD